MSSTTKDSGTMCPTAGAGPQPRRWRASLSQVLVSIAILAFPLAIYGPSGDRRQVFSNGYVLFGLIASCIEVQAFFWLVLVPAIRAVWVRAHWTMLNVRVLREELFRWFRLRALLVAGPCLAVVQPAIGWAAGYRLPGLIPDYNFLIGLAVFAVSFILIVTAFFSVIIAVAAHTGGEGRAGAAFGLLVLALPIFPSGGRAYAYGRGCLQRQLGVDNLSRDCVTLFEELTAAGDDHFIRPDKITSPAIRRLRPTYVILQGKRLRIELHGGHDHYGYNLVKDTPNGRWVFDYGGEILRSWPIGNNP